jgi:selenocysteine lyase/cysteine desulfurase
VPVALHPDVRSSRSDRQVWSGCSTIAASLPLVLGASSPNEIIFVRGATEAINLVAQSRGRRNILAGDEIVISHLEHHANIAPWQQLASEKGAWLRVIPVDDNGQILLEEYQKLLNARTKLVSIAHVSNALGTIVPVREVSDLARRAGARVLHGIPFAVKDLIVIGTLRRLDELAPSAWARSFDGSGDSKGRQA